MPFRDREWEDFQRDCDFFPAYTDYIFGVDDREEVADEPGLHPQIYDPPPRPHRLLGLAQPVQHPLAYDPVRDAIRPRPSSVLPPTSLLKQESSMESMMPTPCPAPRVLPAIGPSIALLRPNALVSDPQYYLFPLQERVSTNAHITQAWAILKSDAVPAQKAKAMAYIKHVSRVAAVKIEEHQRQEAAKKMQTEQEWKAREEIKRQAQQQHMSPKYSYTGLSRSDHHGDADANGQNDSTAHQYAVHDLFQLPAYVQSRLPQLWACTEITNFRPPPTDTEQLDQHRQAQQYLTGFMQSVPPDGRRYVHFVVEGMIELRKQGCDPLALLQNMPRVEDVLGMERGLQTGHVYSSTETRY